MSEAFFKKARAIVEDETIRECLWLVKYGVPFDVAFSLDDHARFAYCIIYSEFERDKEENFNWETLKFNEK